MILSFLQKPFPYLVFLILYFSIGSTHSQDTVRKIQEGESFLKDRNYTAAYQSFSEASRFNPMSTRSLLGFAEAAQHLHKDKESLEAYNKVLELEPENKAAIKGAALGYIRKKEYNNSLNLLKSSLETDPFDPVLAPIQIQILLEMGNYESALKKLEASKSRLQNSKEVQILEAKVNGKTGNFSKSYHIWNTALASSSDDPDLFFSMASLLMDWSEKSSDPEKKQKLEIASEKLERAISLYPDFEEAINALARIRIWQGDFQSAESLSRKLVSIYPQNPLYLYLKAFAEEKNANDSSKDTLKNDLIDILKLDDLDSISRQKAESVALDHFPENHSFRRKLGEYRMQRFRSSKNSLLYDMASHHLSCARELIPSQPEVQFQTLSEYKRTGFFPRYLNLLLFLRKKYSENQKYQYEIENLLNSMKQSIAYREGLIEITGDNLVENYGRTPPVLLMFDLLDKSFLGDYPDLAFLISSSVRKNLSLNPTITLSEVLESARSNPSFEIKTAPYTGILPYTESTYLKIKDSSKKGIKPRFLIYGSLKYENHSIRIDWTIKDSKHEKILSTFKIFSKGRDFIPEAVVRSVSKILASIPPSGSVLKVKDEDLIVNVGALDGLKKGSKIQIYNSSGKSGEATIEEIDYFLSRAVPENGINGLKTISEGDRVFWKR
ncbi:tetratricopeptide repeat protein [Leptospira kirschneri]|uniref:Tetratricopeptide repeat protein n=1 Tax=Leptospira kirschneri str. 200802841 TaxID=1193047 RepID=A0A828Y9E7_9LEPT|nr:tetratricopeptide repeat protein [Leptospira kirschneri]EMO75397.1 tetratricopeptide repeat protein [Leptospira kirschneri str. 200801925]EKO51968.1 tetratricopeptide repeat protein [Leptospira kirschneri str. 200802841]EKO60969.1 tetratricopeptide repeat protein [Leptospira kirschneri str. H2]EKQ83378.1 tetratricopeptide repeat protein [Leptospira kirschneri serovar Grippotyphosa str. Moskva]EKR08166.1 tetratricopeptide repeat protein [Leptospira kirschneri serovar Valbuzzi str. 200702274]